MSIKFLDNIDFNLNQAENLIVEKLASHPDPSTARFYYNTIDHKFYGYNGTEWIDLNNSGWRPAVDTFTDLALLNNLEDGLVVYVNDVDKFYTWDVPTQEWILPNVSKNQLYDFDIPDIVSGDAGKILVVSPEEDGVKYVPFGETVLQYSNFNKISTQSIPNDSNTLVTWNPQNDIHGFWSSGQNTRITIPVGITRIRLSCLLYVQNIRQDRITYIQILLNGNIIEEHEWGWRQVARDRYLKIMSRILEVSTNDYFQIRLYQNSGGARNILTANTYLQVEVLK